MGRNDWTTIALAVVGSLALGCGGSEGGRDASLEQDAAMQADASSRDAGAALDAGAREDGGTMHDDAGRVREDAGTMHDDAGTMRDDAGTMHDDAGTMHDDAGTMHEDAGPLRDDAGTLREDAGPVDPCGCERGTACLRGVCVASCGADLGTLDGALGSDVEVVGHYCVRASASASDGVRVFQASAVYRVGPRVLEATVETWVPGDTATPEITTLGRVEWSDREAALSLDDLVLDAEARNALLTASGRSTGAWASFDLTGMGLRQSDDLERVRSPVLLDEDTWVEQLSAQIVRNGEGAGGIVAELTPTSGFLPGDLDVWREEALLVAGFARRSALGEADPVVYFVPLSEAVTGSPRIALASDSRVLRSTELPYDTFTMLRGGRFVDRSGFRDVGIRTIERRGTEIVPGPRRVIATSTSVFWRVLAIGDDLLLPHRDGVLRVRVTR